jgi:hypothetical protein
MKHHALEEIGECLSLFRRSRLRMRRGRPESGFVWGKPVVFELDGLASESVPTS